ncbi:recombinase family protein [Lysinibacillus capsici]|uniref:recombinase family protein n=1 Tax=Lysinibacillus capsici TaxID=2115968 RepID=UPI003F259B55
MQREGFQEMFRAMRPGDTLYVKSIDRIGRNKHQIKQYLEKLRNKQIRIKIMIFQQLCMTFHRNKIGLIIY